MGDALPKKQVQDEGEITPGKPIYFGLFIGNPFHPSHNWFSGADLLDASNSIFMLVYVTYPSIGSRVMYGIFSDS